MKTDPKPNLGPAAILCNIEYYRAQGAKYSREYREALEQETFWLRKLQDLDKSLK